METKPYVGQRVRLNDTGMRQIGGITSKEMYAASQNMVIVGVENVNAGTPSPPIWAIDVDQPLINRFLLTEDDVDPIN